jgi:aminopeptidase N
MLIVYVVPWPKYYQICLPAIRGAMENISLVTWTEYFVQDETFALEFKEITDLVNIHEMGKYQYMN